MPVVLRNLGYEMVIIGKVAHSDWANFYDFDVVIGPPVLPQQPPFSVLPRVRPKNSTISLTPPNELHNLAADPMQAERLTLLRSELDA